MNNKYRNIGVFSHVDSGKTTLVEQILYNCNVTRKLGRVDKGTAFTDNLDVERERGISVRSSCVGFEYEDNYIQLIDTPGHSDFISQVERALWAIDGAIILVSANDGVESHTELIYKTIKNRNIPIIFFVNKIDRGLVEHNIILNDIKTTLCENVIDMSEYYTNNCLDRKSIEVLADADDMIFERYVDDKTIEKELLEKAIIKQVHCSNIHPVFYGSGLKNIGVNELLCSIIDFLPSPKIRINEELCGVIFGIDNEQSMGRGAHIRLMSGTINTRDNITIGDSTYKVSQIRRLHIGYKDILSSLHAGECGIVYGLSKANVGDIVGNRDLLDDSRRPVLENPPLMQIKVTTDNVNLVALKTALDKLSSEDPGIMYNQSTIEGNNYFNVKTSGNIQIEFLKSQLDNRFSIPNEFSEAQIIYKETIQNQADGFVAYTMPKPCWAVLKFQIKPLPRGSGVRYECKVSNKKIPYRYHKQIEIAIPKALRQGILGWEVDDIAITLVDGEHHNLHTHPLDFIVATPMALMDGLNRGGSQLLEPIWDIDISLPTQFGGRVMSDIRSMRGEVTSFFTQRDRMSIKAVLPVKEAIEYSIKLSAISGGKALMKSKFAGYKKCDTKNGSTCPRRSVDPLNKPKYILAARSAINGGIF